RVDAEPLERLHPVVTPEVLGRVLGVEFPSLALGDLPSRPWRRWGELRALGQEVLARGITSQHRIQLRGIRDAEPQLAGRHVGRGDADRTRLAVSRAPARPHARA